jgi:hypothetical protein
MELALYSANQFSTKTNYNNMLDEEESHEEVSIAVVGAYRFRCFFGNACSRVWWRGVLSQDQIPHPVERRLNERESFGSCFFFVEGGIWSDNRI